MNKEKKKSSNSFKLTPSLLLIAYSEGIFPMAIPELNNNIYWLCPPVRAIIPLETFHVPHSLKRVLKSKKFEVRSDQRFREVIEACAAPRRGDTETWISQEIIEAYTQLHQLGYAHSVETYFQGNLVGGLYGVALGGAFFGESMFHRMTDASKVALVKLVEHLKRLGYQLLDVQFLTPHLAKFGAIEITHQEFLSYLDRALERSCQWDSHIL